MVLNKYKLGSCDEGKVLNANFNSNGNLNVNSNWNSENHNENLGGRSEEVFYFLIEEIIIYLIDLFQPPSILPISWIDSCNRRYFLLSKQCMSLANLRRIFNKSKETIAFSRCNNFWSCLEIPVAIDDSKIGTGLTDEQWKELNRRTRKIATGKKPDSYVLDKNLNPDTWVKPFLVVEILADEITKSPIHTAGLALRFPRLVRFRDDKKAEDTNNLEELKKLFEMQKV